LYCAGIIMHNPFSNVLFIIQYLKTGVN
jgi:hypothetical protein